MALRSLGSTLVAKASPGSVLRQKQEERQQGAVAEQNTGAQPQNVVRENIQQPLEKAVPEGSAKAVSVQPVIQPTSQTSANLNPNTNIAPGIGLPPSGAAQTGRPISAPTGMRSPTAQVAAAPVSGGANIATKIGNAFGDVLAPSQKASYARSVTTPTASPTPTPVQVKNAPSGQTFNPIGFLEGTFGGRVSADQPSKSVDFERNLLQGIASTLGGAIDKTGKFIGGFLPELNVSENLQKFSNAPSNTGIIQNLNKVGQAISGTGSSSKQEPVRPGTQVQSVAPKPVYQTPKPKVQYQTPAPKPAPKQNVVQSAVNWLRSLFR